MNWKTKLTTTIRLWPLIFLATIALSLLTQATAKAFGIDLPEQDNIALVRRMAGWNMTFLFLVLQIVVLLPAAEEILFRWLLWRLPLKISRAAQERIVPACVVAAVSSAIFSFAHYIDYAGWVRSGVFTLRSPDNAFLALFFFGMAQCWLYRKLSSLPSAMLNHALFNLTNLLLLFVIPA